MQVVLPVAPGIVREEEKLLPPTGGDSVGEVASLILDRMLRPDPEPERYPERCCQGAEPEGGNPEAV